MTLQKVLPFLFPYGPRADFPGPIYNMEPLKLTGFAQLSIILLRENKSVSIKPLKC